MFPNKQNSWKAIHLPINYRSISKTVIFLLNGYSFGMWHQKDIGDILSKQILWSSFHSFSKKLYSKVSAGFNKKEVSNKYNTSKTYPKNIVDLWNGLLRKFIIPHLPKWEFNDFLNKYIIPNRIALTKNKIPHPLISK